MLDKKITIPKEYQRLLERGDIQKLVDLTGKKRSTLYKILSDGECKSRIVAAKLQRFFKARQKEISRLHIEQE